MVAALLDSLHLEGVSVHEMVYENGLDQSLSDMNPFP